MIGDKYFLKFTLPNIGVLEGEIKRLKGPHLTELIMKSLPLTSRGLKRDKLFIIPINTVYSVERPTKQGERGNIIYDPQSKSLIIVLQTTKFDNVVGNLGSINKNLELLDALKMSSGVRIEKSDSA